MSIKKIEDGEAVDIPLTKIDDGWFLLPFKLFICKLLAFGSILPESLLSIFMFTFWMFGIFIQKTPIQNSDDTSEYLHASEHVKTCMCIMRSSILPMMKRARNDPVYWRLRWLYFYTIMGIRFVMSKGYNKLHRELLWHGCSILCPLQPIVKPFVYWGVIWYIITICITN